MQPLSKTSRFLCSVGFSLLCYLYQQPELTRGLVRSTTMHRGNSSKLPNKEHLKEIYVVEWCARATALKARNFWGSSSCVGSLWCDMRNIQNRLDSHASYLWTTWGHGSWRKWHCRSCLWDHPLGCLISQFECIHRLGDGGIVDMRWSGPYHNYLDRCQHFTSMIIA